MEKEQQAHRTWEREIIIIRIVCVYKGVVVEERYTKKKVDVFFLARKREVSGMCAKGCAKAELSWCEKEKGRPVGNIRFPRENALVAEKERNAPWTVGHVPSVKKREEKFEKGTRFSTFHDILSDNSRGRMPDIFASFYLVNNLFRERFSSLEKSVLNIPLKLLLLPDQPSRLMRNVEAPLRRNEATMPRRLIYVARYAVYCSELE